MFHDFLGYRAIKISIVRIFEDSGSRLMGFQDLSVVREDVESEKILFFLSLGSKMSEIAALSKPAMFLIIEYFAFFCSKILA